MRRTVMTMIALLAFSATVTGAGFWESEDKKRQVLAPEQLSGPQAADVFAVVQAAVEERTAFGRFDLQDEHSGVTRMLRLRGLRREVYRTPDGFFVCADFMDIQTGERLDVDFHVDQSLQNVTTHIHEVDGNPRFGYDSRGRVTAVKKKK